MTIDKIEEVRIYYNGKWLLTTELCELANQQQAEIEQLQKQIQNENTFEKDLCVIYADENKQLLEELAQFKAQQPVRCGECIHRHTSEFCECRAEDAFCSDGERKGG